MSDSNYLYRLIAARVKLDRNGKDRRQKQQPIEGEEQRHGCERRKPEPVPHFSQQQQLWNGQYTEKNPLSELINACCRSVNDHGLQVEVIVRIHPKK
jgi:hypothetical protein